MSLTARRVELIRTSDLPDTHWARVWRVTRNAVRQARIGETWVDHPTPPDARHRGYKCGGRPRHAASITAVPA